MPQSHKIKIDTRGKTRKEFTQDVSLAICEVQMLAYERRSLDLDESQTYSMLLLLDLLSQLIQKGGRR